MHIFLTWCSNSPSLRSLSVMYVCVCVYNDLIWSGMKFVNRVSWTLKQFDSYFNISGLFNCYTYVHTLFDIRLIAKKKIMSFTLEYNFMFHATKTYLAEAHIIGHLMMLFYVTFIIILYYLPYHNTIHIHTRTYTLTLNNNNNNKKPVFEWTIKSTHTQKLMNEYTHSFTLLYKIHDQCNFDRVIGVTCPWIYLFCIFKHIT